ncbi:hypothetical protein DVH24_038108 [Malus domestica]|uniref:Rx N-terminal domain-containing protein n=1 Tax=Malus domestica TaxID=3750 RepID=A0A498KBT2_MALDO|nr:hypothetical protein DVH24_038108 [Malus domestica]
MALVGEALLSGSIKLLCDKIASGQFMDFFRARRLNHSLMDKLKVTLMTLHAVLDDAEEKQIVNAAVAMWLDELKDAVFDAQDLVDEMDTEALRRKVKDQTKQTQVCNFLSTSLSPFNYKGMNGRIKDLFQRLEHLAEQRNRLDLREGVGRKVSQRTPTTSVVEEGFCPYGRDTDKEKLKTLLLPSDNESSSNFSVVPIVGMGGVGKTTLAQLLYNDEQVKEHFDIHAWVCVSEQYDALRVIKTLTFVLGKSTGSNIGELRELSHLRGKISILNLQNVVGAFDALLRDKKDLNEVELAWGYEVSNDFVKKKHVLERLQPPVNLVKLTIKWYGGTSFPNWVGDSSFSNLQVMRLSGCSDCSSLPPVGRLPALKELYVGGMTSITSVGVEFYGGNQPFQSLEKLEFVYMPKWEEWLPSPSGGESPDFPRLKELILDQCPKLRGYLPTHLPSLVNLGVYRSNVLHWSMETLPSLQKLDIDIVGGKEWLPQMVRNSNCLQSMTLSFCSSLLSLPTNGLPTTLTSLRISYCKKLEFLSEMMAKLTSLQSLRLSNSCDSLSSFPLGIFPKLSSLEICSCRNLKSLSVEGGADENLSRLNSLRIETCPNLVAFPDGGLPTPNLTSFYVSGCKSLKLLPDRMHTLTALQELSISCLPNVVSFAQGGLPPNLQSLSISDCNRLRPSVEWGLQGLVSLRQFRVSRESKDLLETLLNEQLLPASLHTLQISSVWNLKSLAGKGLEHLTSLQHLQIEWCGSLKFLPKEGFPASLSYLNIRRCPSLKKRYLKKRYENVARIPCVKIDGEVNIL